MLLKINHRLINPDQITYAELRVSGSPPTTHVGLWIEFTQGPTGTPQLALEGREANRVWAKLSSMAEDITPEAHS